MPLRKVVEMGKTTLILGALVIAEAKVKTSKIDARVLAHLLRCGMAVLVVSSWRTLAAVGDFETVQQFVLSFLA